MRNYEMKEFFILLSAVWLCRIISTQSDVRLPPHLIRSQINNVFYKMAGMFRLECGANGTPTVRYEWKKNGVRLDITPPKFRNGPDGDIAVHGVSLADEGYYQCFAINQYGTAISNMIQVRMAFRNPQYFTFSFKKVVEGTPFYIEPDREECFPKPSYRWAIARDQRTRTTLSLSKRIQMAENGDLHFAYALSGDARNGLSYECLQFYQFLDMTTGNRHTTVTVTRNPEGNISQSAPTLAFSSETETVALVGESATLRCFFYGYPEPNISWIGPRNTLLIGSRFLLTEFETQLQISNITPSDEGDYSCIGSNVEGNITHTLRIRVGAAPHFKNTTDDGPYNLNANITEGGSVTFNCSAFAKPLPRIVWLQNGQPIDTDTPPKRFIFSNGNRSLTIRDVCRDCVDRESKTDLMVIQCNASNVHGYAFAQGYLNVLMKTRVTIRGSKSVVAVDFLEEKQFVFQCYVTTDPSTPPTVRWYKTEPFGDLVRDEPPFVYVAKEFLIIMVYPNCSSKCSKYLGEYRCTGGSNYSSENQTITLSYQYRPQEALSRSEDATWVILGAGAIAFALFLIGVFIGFLSNRRSNNVKRRMKNRRVPDPPCRHNDVGYESGVILLEAAGNNEISIRRESSMYEQIGYASIDQALKEMTHRGRAVSDSSEAQAYGRYESIDGPQKEAVSGFVRSLDKDDMYDDTRCSFSREEPANCENGNQQQIKGCEATQSGSDKYLDSNEQLKVANDCSDVGREEVNFYLELSPTEDGPYLNLSSREGNSYLNLDLKKMDPSLSEYGSE